MTSLLLHPGPVPLDALLEALGEHLPDMSVHVWPDIDGAEDVEYALVSRFPEGAFATLPRLRLVGSLHAGVDHLLRDRSLPAHVPITRPVTKGGDTMMNEYVLAQVMLYHRDLPAYAAAQREGRWTKLQPVTAQQRTVGILGYGAIAAPVAELLLKVGFDVAAWARHPRPSPSLRLYFGEEGLHALLARSSILINLLPLTPLTADLIDAALLARLPHGAVLINVGRGEHVVETDLLAALDSGHLAGATLDVFRQEPLPLDSPLWRHRRILVTPHACRVVQVDQVVTQFAAEVERVRRGQTLQHGVNRAFGY